MLCPKEQSAKDTRKEMINTFINYLVKVGEETVVVVVVTAGTGVLKKFLIKYPAAEDAANCHSAVQLIEKCPSVKDVRITRIGALKAAVKRLLMKS
jgi:hypothetical protein